MRVLFLSAVIDLCGDSANVRYLGKWIFHGCNRLQYLEIRHDPEFIGEWIINKAATIRCYKGSKVDRYCQQSGFKVEYFS